MSIAAFQILTKIRSIQKCNSSLQFLNSKLCTFLSKEQEIYTAPAIFQSLIWIGDSECHLTQAASVCCQMTFLYESAPKLYKSEKKNNFISLSLILLTYQVVVTYSCAWRKLNFHLGLQILNLSLI